ncbi:SH3 domain-containing protein [Salinimicrobium flavum]|uniref:Tetratricopeptide repeat protein n=1 Tax=Salinimicrobium flavum TaxID=1737065 RepID=A0ABW5IU86_9FLAO
MKKVFYIVFFLMGMAGNGQNQELFENANSAYADGRYEEAIEAYDQILQNGETSVAVHYNLGNAHYKLNHIAPSIYHYEKALLLKPKDEDVKNNLTFAKNMALDAIEEPAEEGFSGFFNSATSALSPSGWGWLAIIGMMVFVSFFLAYYFSRRSLFKRIFFIAGMFFLLFSVFSAGIGLIKQSAVESSTYAIVFSEEVEVKGEPNSRSSEVFVLHEGAKVKITEDYQDWFEIELPNGSQGWLLREDVKRL